MRTRMTILAIAILTAVLAACAATSGCGDDATCVVEKALAETDAGYCQELSEQLRPWCITEVALNSGDEAVCERLPAASRKYCVRDLIVASGELAGCERLAGTVRDDCFNRIALNTSSWQACLAMGLGEYREECIETISRKTTDPYGCLKLDDLNPNKGGCVLTTSMKSENVETCQTLDENSTRACLVNIAMNMDAEADCAKLPATYQNACRKRFNATNGN